MRVVVVQIERGIEQEPIRTLHRRVGAVRVDEFVFQYEVIVVRRAEASDRIDDWIHRRQRVGSS